MKPCYKSAFNGCRSIGCMDEVWRNSLLCCETFANDIGSIVNPDDTYQITTCSKRSNVAGDVSGTADNLLNAIKVNNSCRSFRRYAPHVAVAESIQHQVSHDQY